MTENLSFLLFFSTLLLYSSLSLAVRSPDLKKATRSPAFNAERLIRSLNLTPKEANADNGRRDSGDLGGKRIVERSFAFPGLSDKVSPGDLGHHAGYYKLSHSHDARLFYFFFESRHNKKDPVVIWLTGGPGCSSELALFYENGPFKIANNLSLVWNNFGWDQILNRLANVFDDEKFQICLPLEEEEEKNHDENIKADIPREHEPVKIAAGDLSL